LRHLSAVRLAPRTSCALLLCMLVRRRPRTSTLFPYTTLFRSLLGRLRAGGDHGGDERLLVPGRGRLRHRAHLTDRHRRRRQAPRSEEHTSELQSRFDLVCRLLLEKKNKLLSTERRARCSATAC